MGAMGLAWWMVWVVCSLAVEDPHLEDLQRAASLQNAGRVEEAIVVYDAVLAVVPSHPDAWHLKGLAVYTSAEGLPKAQWRARMAEAVEMIRRASMERPTDVNLLTNLGEVLRASGDVVGAAEVLTQGLTLNPSSIGTWRNLAAVAFDANDHGEVARCNAKILELLRVDPFSGARSPSAEFEDVADLERRARYDLAEATQKAAGEGTGDHLALFEAATVSRGVARQSVGVARCVCASSRECQAFLETRLVRGSVARRASEARFSAVDPRRSRGPRTRGSPSGGASRSTRPGSSTRRRRSTTGLGP